MAALAHSNVPIAPPRGEMSRLVKGGVGRADIVAAPRVAQRLQHELVEIRVRERKPPQLADEADGERVH